MTGRDEEMGLVARALRRQGRPAGVVLAGAAGVGKTRIAREAVAAAAAAGVRTFWVAATDSARDLPLGCFTPLLADTAGADGTGTDSAVRGFRRTFAALLASPAVLAVDDAHLLDGASAAFVHQLAVGTALPLVVTIRSGEPAPDAVTALWKDGHLERLEVQPLPLSESHALLERALDGPVEAAGAARLWQVTRGNVLYLQHLVDGEREAGRLSRPAGVWHWSGAPVLRPQLLELLDTRIGLLPDAVRHVGDLLALSEPLPVAVLSGLTGAADVEAAEARGLITVSGAQAGLAHPLYGELLRARIKTLRGRRLRGELVRALHDANDPDVVRRATLSLDGDRDGGHDPELLLGAARLAMSRLDAATAERLARGARDAGGGFDAVVLHAAMLSTLRQDRAAEEALTEAAALATTDEQRVGVVRIRVLHALRAVERAEDVSTIVQAAVTAIGDPSAQAEPLALGAVCQAFQGRTREAEPAARAVLARPDAPDAAIVWAAQALSMCLSVRGRAGPAVETAERGHASAVRAAFPWTSLLSLGSWEVQALQMTGRLVEAQHAAERHEAQVSGSAVALVEGFLTGRTALARGEVRTAARVLRDAVVRLSQDMEAWPLVLSTDLAVARALSGDLTGARDALEAARGWFRPHFAYFEPELRVAEAWVAAAHGRHSEAVSCARSAAELSRRRDQPAFEVLAHQTAVCFGDTSATTRLATLARTVEGPRAATAAAHSAALAAADAHALDGVSRRWAEMGALLPAADAAAQAARIHDVAARRGSAHASAARAARLATACEGARTPALLAAESPLPLTSREHEIAHLVAAGLSNREIATDLVLSVRTVEGHIYRACSKLGVSDRTALAASLRP